MQTNRWRHRHLLSVISVFFWPRYLDATCIHVWNSLCFELRDRLCSRAPYTCLEKAISQALMIGQFRLLESTVGQKGQLSQLTLNPLMQVRTACVYMYVLAVCFMFEKLQQSWHRPLLPQLSGYHRRLLSSQQWHSIFSAIPLVVARCVRSPGSGRGHTEVRGVDNLAPDLTSESKE